MLKNLQPQVEPKKKKQRRQNQEDEHIVHFTALKVVHFSESCQKNMGTKPSND